MAAHILFVLRSLADLEAFIKNRENGLLKKVEKEISKDWLRSWGT